MNVSGIQRHSTSNQTPAWAKEASELQPEPACGQEEGPGARWHFVFPEGSDKVKDSVPQHWQLGCTESGPILLCALQAFFGSCLEGTFGYPSGLPAPAVPLLAPITVGHGPGPGAQEWTHHVPKQPGPRSLFIAAHTIIYLSQVWN